ncbi:Holliday junction resolvase RuvX [Neobittarella massiliensis]|uniref:Putative pre-16S rRNA nuclease n=1 Tax=Neobittarella massiliensis (ex Bilen et al. 2018) TaxID=2041842 RepID=A0A8J6IK97_9FIRM|nr:Holliday junction resolvase RuvX [Neobittarella massiliensis]MBC3514974.1 Holliday junction resolvase RuvX [Neobittarella massiliensis]
MVLLAVDYGDARTGLALCDKGEMLARPAGVIHQLGMDKTVKQVVEFALQNGVEGIVVGLPKNMDGSLGERAEKCQKVARKIAGRLNATSIKVEMFDERSTTISAIQILNEADVRGKKRKDTVDAVAATIILEAYMAWRKRQQPEGEDR